MKRTLALFLSLFMVLVLMAGCSSKLPDTPDDAAMQEDVLNYITELIDGTAEITEFHKDSGKITDGVLEAQCTASFTGETQSDTLSFLLNYVIKKGAWVLDKCQMLEPDPAEEDEEASVKMSDDLNDHMICIDNQVYQLPFPFSDLLENGWSLSEEDVSEDLILMPEGARLVSVFLGSNAVEVSVYNNSSSDKAMKDCLVGGIRVFDQDLDNVELASIAKGINLRSTAEEINEAFGEPYQDPNGENDPNRINYTKDRSEYDYTQFRFSDEDGEKKLKGIIIFNMTDASGKVYTNADEPLPYLSEYRAPSELGTDAISGNIELDGDLYCLPAPLSVFLDKGWSIAEEVDGYVIPGGSIGPVKLQRGDAVLEVYVYNFSCRGAQVRNCAVYLAASDSDAPVSFRLPNGVYYGQGRDDSIAAAGDQFPSSIYESIGTFSGNYYDYEKDQYINFRGDSTVKTISYQYGIWHW